MLRALRGSATKLGKTSVYSGPSRLDAPVLYTIQSETSLKHMPEHPKLRDLKPPLARNPSRPFMNPETPTPQAQGELKSCLCRARRLGDKRLPLCRIGQWSFEAAAFGRFEDAAFWARCRLQSRLSGFFGFVARCAAKPNKITYIWTFDWAF